MIGLSVLFQLSLTTLNEQQKSLLCFYQLKHLTVEKEIFEVISFLLSYRKSVNLGRVSINFPVRN